MIGQQITFIKQRGKKDCGIACIAMVAGLNYEEVKCFFSSVEWKDRNPHGLSFGEILIGLERFECGFLSAKCWEFSDTTEERRERLPWITIPSVSIVAVNARSGGDWHWVVFRSSDQMLFDPEKGKREPNNRTFAWGYIQVDARAIT